MFNLPIYLASASPRRQQLLKEISLNFKVIPTNIEENLKENLTPRKTAEKLSCLKAESLLAQITEGIIIGADTVVSLNGEVLGKPATKEEARQILQKLSEKTHSVFTGLTVIKAETNEILTDSEETRVTFDEISDSEINDYIESGEPMDKAGAYGIQGRAGLFINRIEGCYFNVVGLPLNLLYKMLKQLEKGKDNVRK